ncbi:MAG: hypothetical protein ABI480_09970 [Chitinophagaceae bacterium]
MENNWKLQLRYGKLQTAFKHRTLLAEGVANEMKEGFLCRPGPAFMGIKVWISSDEEAAEIIQSIGTKIGFEVTGDIQIFDTEPLQPPQDKPYGYDINFTPFEKI